MILRHSEQQKKKLNSERRRNITKQEKHTKML